MHGAVLLYIKRILMELNALQAIYADTWDNLEKTSMTTRHFIPLIKKDLASKENDIKVYISMLLIAIIGFAILINRASA